MERNKILKLYNYKEKESYHAVKKNIKIIDTIIETYKQTHDSMLNKYYIFNDKDKGYNLIDSFIYSCYNCIITIIDDNVSIKTTYHGKLNLYIDPYDKDCELGEETRDTLALVQKFLHCTYKNINIYSRSKRALIKLSIFVYQITIQKMHIALKEAKKRGDLSQTSITGNTDNWHKCNVRTHAYNIINSLRSILKKIGELQKEPAESECDNLYRKKVMEVFSELFDNLSRPEIESIKLPEAAE